MSNTALIEITYYMKIAIDINKKVGGTRAYQAESNSRDRFLIIKENIDKSIKYITSKFDERTRRRGDALQINAQIRQTLEEIYNQLDRMRDSVASQKGNNTGAQSVKYQIIERYTTKARELQDLIDNQAQLEKKIMMNERKKTETQKKQLLLGDTTVPSRLKSKPQNNRGPTEIELAKMEEWKQRDKQIDDGLEQVLDGIKKWKQGVIMTGELTNQSILKVDKLTANVDDVNESLFQSNKKLKGIVEKLRKPHKFCLDIVLVLILIALVVGIIKLSGS